MRQSASFSALAAPCSIILPGDMFLQKHYFPEEITAASARA
jgi:hypothetical protein